MKRIMMATIGAIMCLSVVTLGQPNLLVNGDFETPVVGTTAGYRDWPIIITHSDWDAFIPAQVPGWTIEISGNDGGPPGPDLEFWSDLGPMPAGASAHSGIQCVELDGWDPTKISQVVTTTAGFPYELSYAWRPRSGASCDMDVSVDGSVVASHSVSGNFWTVETYVFTAASTSTTIAFAEVGPDDQLGMLLDATSLIQLSATIEKDMVDEGELGDQITITLNVDNPYSEAITVEDVLPDGLTYIPDIDAAPGNQNLKIDGSYVDPTAVTIEDNTISVEVDPGPHTITFVVQVVEVQCEEVDVTNVANVYNPEDDLDDSDEVEITLYPYEGFVKEAVIVYEDVVDGVITVGELVQWDMTITLPNNFAWAITNAVLKDNLGGNLGMADDDVDNDKDDLIDEGGPGDLPAGYNTIPSGTLSYETKGKTKKVQLEITGISVGIGGSLDFVLGIFTDCNPGKGKNAPHQEYTSPGDYELNSGATVKFIDPATGLQLSAHTCPITVTAYPPPVLP
ncbi:MAG: hypothetical protein JSV03_06720 [Planctomycetota bacterium]|nr:MAG: hypothetical protein JSV03_06720 [Planctomycetota bacterium]